MILFVLKQKELDLAVAESKAAAGWNWWERKEQSVDGTILLQTRARPKHLGLTRFAVKVIASCAPGNLHATLASIPWNRLVRNSYRVQLTKQVSSKENERQLATIIWRSLKKPVVDLENPKSTIDIVVTSKAVHIGIRVWENTEDFESRRAHLRPELHPSSMHPAMARALVNISCAQSVHDPFCGSGGILIESGLAHKKTSGADIEPSMMAMAKRNCAAYGLHPNLRIADATQWVPRVGAVICDLPYGKSTKPVELNNLIEAFLTRAGQSTKRAVIGLPQPAAFPKTWKVKAHLTSYVHKSMTKHFYVLEHE
jgi:tRNA (guanine10-N2)-dimethyltransferase